MPGSTSHKNEGGLKSITNDLRRYVEMRLELFVLTISERVSFIVADSIQRIIGILLLFGGFFFLWFGLGFYVGSLIGSVALGFVISSIPLLLAGLIFMKLKPKSVTKSIQAGVMNEVMQSLDQMDIKDNIVLNESGKKEKTTGKKEKEEAK